MREPCPADCSCLMCRLQRSLDEVRREQQARRERRTK